MHILPKRWREKLEDAGLTPPPTAEETALWAIEEKALSRRQRYSAAARAALVVGAAGVVKFIRHPDMPTSKMLATLGIGVLFCALLFGMFLLQAGTDRVSERVRFIRARRMHRAILEEPDLGVDDDLLPPPPAASGRLHGDDVA